MCIDESTVEMFKRIKILSNETNVNIFYKLLKEEKMTFTELNEELDIPKNTLHYHLKQLKQSKIISQKNDKWPYTITDFGRNIDDIIKKVFIEKKDSI